MTWPPGGNTSNFAGAGSYVGGQAGVHVGDNNMYVAPDARPEEKYRLGESCLQRGMAPQARVLIEDAIAHEHDTSRVRFHWLLALLSGRTFRQFPQEDVRQINAAKANPACTAPDLWGAGSQIIFRFFDSLLTLEDDLSVVDDLMRLDADPRNKILRHLEVFLKGPLENRMWGLERDRAVRVREGGNRIDRVWKFFVPAPVKPLIHHPEEPAWTIGKWVVAALSAAALVTSAGYVGWELLRHFSILGLLALIAAVFGGRMAVVSGVERQFLAQRRRAKEAELRAPRTSSDSDSRAKFATEVNDLYRYYFRRCVPDGVDRDQWLRETNGIRARLCAEMVELYRGTRDSSAEVRWLIRHHVREVRERAIRGEFQNIQVRFRPRMTTEAAFVAGGLALVGGTCWAIGFMTALAAIKALVIAGVLASTWGLLATWLPMAVARKRFDAEHAEFEKRMDACQRAREEWQQTLADRPSDEEMAAWLDADQKYLMGQAMDHYKLPRNEVIAHAFIAQPGEGGKRKRVPLSITRHSRYRVHVFLLTADGVRQVIFSLTFGSGRSHITRRTNYRFDSIASVDVTPGLQSVELQLVSGQKISMEHLSDSDQDSPAATSETAVEVRTESPLDTTLAPASLANTIFVLEGIAAEGKEWIMREQRQEATASSGSGFHRV